MFRWLDAGPTVGSNLQKPAGSHSQPDSSSITQQYVQYHLIPPALGEVWQQVHEKQLRKWRRLSENVFMHFKSRNHISYVCYLSGNMLVSGPALMESILLMNEFGSRSNPIIVSHQSTISNRNSSSYYRFVILSFSQTKTTLVACRHQAQPML